MAVPNQNVYLDYNASAPAHSKVIEAVTDALKIQGNPSSIHADGRAARASMEDARESVAHLIGASPQSITFVSGGTEANATVIDGLRSAGVVVNVLGSSIEHPSILNHIPTDCRVPVDEQGLVDLTVMADRLAVETKPFLFCIMLANNETGVVQPVAKVVELVHQLGGLVLCDAIQGLGKLPFDVTALGADFYTFSAHKIGGPKGTGCILSSSQVQWEAVFPGGGQERRKRAGTENTPGICGFGMAARLVDQHRENYVDSDLRDRFELELQRVRPESVILGQQSHRLPNTTNVALPGVRSERQILKLDLAGFSVSAGSACSSGKVEPSHVLLAMGLPDEIAQSAIRVSTGPDTSWQNLERFISAWEKL